jgi:ATP-dependent Lon protease
VRRLRQTTPYLQANVEAVPEETYSEAFQRSPRTEALLRQTYTLFGEYAQMAGGVADEVLSTVMDSRDPGFLADYIAQNISLRYTDKQEILEESPPTSACASSTLLAGSTTSGFEHEMESKVRGSSWSAPSGADPANPDPGPPERMGRARDRDVELTPREKITALKLDEETEKHLLKEVTHSRQPFAGRGAVIATTWTCV